MHHIRYCSVARTRIERLRASAMFGRDSVAWFVAYWLLPAIENSGIGWRVPSSTTTYTLQCSACVETGGQRNNLGCNLVHLCQSVSMVSVISTFELGVTSRADWHQFVELPQLCGRVALNPQGVPCRLAEVEHHLYQSFIELCTTRLARHPA